MPPRNRSASRSNRPRAADGVSPNSTTSGKSNACGKPDRVDVAGDRRIEVGLRGDRLDRPAVLLDHPLDLLGVRDVEVGKVGHSNDSLSRSSDVLRVACGHRREHRLAALVGADDLRGDHAHHDTRVRVASILLPQVVRSTATPYVGKCLAVLVDQLALDPAAFVGQHAGAEEVADVGDAEPVTGRLPVDGGDRSRHRRGRRTSSCRAGSRRGSRCSAGRGRRPSRRSADRTARSASVASATGSVPYVLMNPGRNIDHSIASCCESSPFAGRATRCRRASGRPIAGRAAWPAPAPRSAPGSDRSR